MTRERTDPESDGDGATTTDDVAPWLAATFTDRLTAVRACAVAAADAAAGTGDGEADSDGDCATRAVRHGIEDCLRARGVWESLPAVLAAAVERVGGRLRATPVAAPPYVAATATGVVLRATLDGGRLVVGVDALDVRRTDGRLELTPRSGPLAASVRVEFHAHGRSGQPG